MAVRLEKNAINSGDGAFTTPANLASDVWRPSALVVEQDSTSGAQPSQSVGAAPWRAEYNSVEPAFTSSVEQQQPQNPPQSSTLYNTATQTTNSSEVQDPNANGNTPTGPVWQPNAQYNWNSPGPAQQSSNGDLSLSGSNGGASASMPSVMPAQDNLYDPHITLLDQGLQYPIGFGGNLVIGGVAGVLAGGPISYTLNKTAESIVRSAQTSDPTNPSLIGNYGSLARIIPNSWTSRLNSSKEKFDQVLRRNAPSQDGAVYNGASWWREHFDPRVFKVKQLNIIPNSSEDYTRQFQNLRSTELADLEVLREKNQPLETAKDDVLERLTQLQNRQNIFNQQLWPADPESRQAQTQIAKDNGLIDDGEAELLENYQALHFSRPLPVIPNEASEEPSFFGDSVAGNFIKGAGFVGVTMLANNYLDRLFNGNDHKQGVTDSNGLTGIPIVGSMSQSWHTNELLVPMAFAGGKGLVNKALWTGGALIAGHVLDKVLPASQDQKVSNIFRPTGIDAVLQGAAWVLPADNKAKAGMIAGAWVIGRIANIFQGPSGATIKDSGFAEMQTDMQQRTAASMDASINTFKQLGAKSDQALTEYAVDWLSPDRKYDGPLSSYRGAVILCDAWGQSRLAHGTLISKSAADFILPGLNLDLGAQALSYLIIAQTNVTRAIEQTKNEMGKEDHGKTVTESEITDLNQVGAQINSVIQNQIYGKHDIPTAINDLGNLARDNMQGATLLMSDINNQLAMNQGSSNKQFVAKLFRDLATLDLGMAQYYANGPDASQAGSFLYGSDSGRQTTYNDGQQMGYDGALDAINLAKKYDPSNPDLPQLEAVANQLEQKIPAAVQNQQSDAAFNPLNVNDQVANPGSQALA